MISSVHLSPTRSSARASGDHWLYGCRLGGGTEGIVRRPYTARRSVRGISALTFVDGWTDVDFAQDSPRRRRSSGRWATSSPSPTTAAPRVAGDGRDAASRAPRARRSLRPQLAVHVPRGRARRPAVPGPRVEAGARGGPAGRRPLDARRRRGARARARPAARLAGRPRRRRPSGPRCASPSLAAERGRGRAVRPRRHAAWRSAAASSSTTPRCSPRPPPPRTSASRTACRPPATSAATARWRRPRAGCSPRAPTACPALRVGRLLFAGEDRIGEAHAAAQAPALRAG